MQRVLPLALLLAAFLAVPAQAGSGWLTNLEKAKKQAKTKKQPILVNFTGSDWCPECKLLKKDVLKSKEFKELAKGLVLVVLDFPQRKRQDKRIRARNAAIKSHYKVKGFPTLLIVDFEGKEVGRTVGFRPKGKAKWLAKTRKLLAENFDAETGKAKAEPKPKPKGAAPSQSKAGPSKGWQTSYEAAVQRSRETGRPILANFTGSDWCTWCVTLKKEVYETPEFKAWARDTVILLELDYPSRAPQAKALKEQNKELAARYQVEGFPVVLFLDAKGKQLGTCGYVPGGPKAWIAVAEKAIKSR